MCTKESYAVSCVVRCGLRGLSWSTAGAQTVLTESDAIARLSTDSPRVRAIRSGIELARADVVAASRWPNPRLYVGREAVAGVSETITSVLQPLPITGQRRFEIQAADALVDATTFRADDAMRRARADLRLAYADLVAAQTRERELTAARDRLQELAGILSKREREGDAAGFDRLRAEREVLDVEADRVIAAADRARAQGRLAGFFAAAVDPASLVAADRVVTARDLPPVEALRRAGRANARRGSGVGQGDRVCALCGARRGQAPRARTRNHRRHQVVKL